MPKNVIDRFTETYRNRDYTVYSKLATIAEKQIGDALLANGIMSRCASRAKDPDRLRSKLLGRKTKYETFADIRSDIVDFAGLRVEFYFPTDRIKIESLIQECFNVKSDGIKRHPEAKAKQANSEYSQKFQGYEAVHFRCNLKKDSLSSAEQYLASKPFELQIISIFMHAWAAIEHDLVYKKMRGQPSDEERRMVDIINGMASATELVVDQLSRQIESRTRTASAPFDTIFELAAFLSKTVTDSGIDSFSSYGIEGLDLLWLYLTKVNLHYPQKIAELLSTAEKDWQSGRICQALLKVILESHTKYITQYVQWRFSEIAEEEEGSLYNYTYMKWRRANVETEEARAEILFFLHGVRVIRHANEKKAKKVFDLDIKLVGIGDTYQRLTNLRSAPNIPLKKLKRASLSLDSVLLDLQSVGAID